MGELKDIRSQQESLVERAKEANRKLWLAGLGAVSKVETQGRKQLDKYRYAGELAIGAEAASQNRYLVAARGLVATVRAEGDELVNKWVDSGKQQNSDTENPYVLAAIGAFATLRDESQRVFNDLVATGEKRQQG